MSMTKYKEVTYLPKPDSRKTKKRTTAVNFSDDHIFTNPETQEILNHVHNGFYIIDIHRQIVYWSKSAEQVTGYTPLDISGTICSELLPDVRALRPILTENSCPLEKTLTDGQCREEAVYLQHKRGYLLLLRVRTFPIPDETGKTMGVGAVFLRSNDKTHTSRPQEKCLTADGLSVVSFIDAATGLKNQHFANSFLKTRLLEVAQGLPPFALMAITINDLDVIQQQGGQTDLNTLLLKIGKHLSSALRPADLLVHWNKDTFFVIIDTQINPIELHDIPHAFLQHITDCPVIVDNASIKLSPSIGITLAMPDDCLDSLIERSINLMQLSKKQAGCRINIG